MTGNTRRITSYQALSLLETELDHVRVRLGYQVAEVRLNKLGLVSDVNEATCDLFGYRRVELVGQRLLDLIRPDQLHSPTWHLGYSIDVLEGRLPGYTCVCPAIRGDGQHIVISCVVLSTRDDRDAIVGITVRYRRIDVIEDLHMLPLPAIDQRRQHAG